ncbi:fibronectin type III domain-containing protein [Flavobacterium sp. N3904]|uniref:fibronectin type III domain-containing protein n=1 Tax=Flavobacterium sp. N3904 TaxID=2986835 RepID=UPI0022257536|nr:fibronectin type III domain-containing protein [Flavobacterium sp. N3904]
MKYLVYFLFFSVIGFSQNYQYAIEEAQKTLPVPPTGLVASQITQISADLTWTASATNTSVSSYGIYSNNNLLAKSVGAGTTYKVTGLTPETTYTFTVRATDTAGITSVDSNPVTFTTAKVAGINNQLEEIEYFKAYLLPLAQKATLQAALDKYGSVRLEKGDYSGVNIVMHSNQRLYGYPSLSKVSNITIAAGSSNVHLEDLLPADSFITLQAGGVISGCTFKSIKWAILRGTNIMLENSSFINYGGHIQLDCSQSGYFRNNKIIKHQSGTVSNILVLKGNSTTPSYGNVHLHSNFLTPHGDATDLDGLQSATFVGIDAESWNFTGEGTKAMFSAKNMGNVKITDFGGGNGGSPFKTPSYDVDANNLFFLNKYNNYPTDVLSLKTNMFLVNGIGPYIRKAGTVTGFDLLGNLEFSNAIKYNGVEQIAAMTNSSVITTLTNTIKGTQYTPWTRPNWEILPDPLGANWKTDRVGKPDQTSYIQGLIDTKGIAELPEGVFYIKSTLKMPLDNKHGIFGKGTGKTVIVGLTDDFPLISLVGGKDGNFTLANLTLQGGSIGVYASTDYGSQNIAYQNMKFVVFRNQNYGIHLKKTGGFDNNFLENLGFVNCNIGFFQEPTAGNSGEDNSAYVDKTMFYKNQYINCGIAISMLATRADNLDAWVDCKFDGGKTALALAGQNYPIVANCDFTNYSGVNVINSNSISMYNSNVYNNKITGSTIISSYTNIEGCKFLDSSKMFSPMLYTSLNNHIINSVITGNVLANVPANQGYGKESAVYANSTLLSNPTLSKLLVNVKEGVPTIVINATPDPYPQLLVTQ